jgi:hypothetical protein
VNSSKRNGVHLLEIEAAIRGFRHFPVSCPGLAIWAGFPRSITQLEETVKLAPLIKSK